MRAAGTVLGALGLFGAGEGALNEADLLVARTLAHVACVALLQEHPPTAVTIVPPLQAALTERIVVDQATGFVSEQLQITTGFAFELLRRYSRDRAEHLSDVARQLISQPAQRGDITAALDRLISAG